MSCKSGRQALYTIRGEICLIATNLKRTNRWATHQQEARPDHLLKKLNSLKDSLDTGNPREALNQISSDANYFLVPFLDVIKSEDVSGPLTILALSSLEKFIVTEIINEGNAVNGGAIEAITDAVIHAHFVSTDTASDELVLAKILQVLHRLFLSPLGTLLSNENVCELMQSCFRMTFIERANELLRRSAEVALTDMIRLLFFRIPTFKVKSSARALQPPTPSLGPGLIVSKEFKESKEDIPEIHVEEPTPPRNSTTILPPTEYKTPRGVKFSLETSATPTEESPQGGEEEKPKSSSKAAPYGIPCIKELFRFLISLVNPHEKENTELMIHLALKLILVALETGVEHIPKHNSLMIQVKNDLCKNLFALISFPANQNSTSNFLLGVLRILFLIFESNIRWSLKYQLEVFLLKMTECLGENQTQGQIKWNYEQKEVALEFLVALWKLPSFTTELYLNYDCDLFCSNLFEDTTKLLSKLAFPMNPPAGSGNFQGHSHFVGSVHIICLEGLVTILDGIESHCTNRIALNTSAASDESNSSVFYHDHEDDEREEVESEVKRRDISGERNRDSETQDKSPRKGIVTTGGGSKGVEEAWLPTHEMLMAIRHKKKIFHTGSEQFNQSASKGIEFLQTHGLLSTPLDPGEVAGFLRENPLLDKKSIGDFISARKNAAILKAFVKSFDFSKLRVDEALRYFLETFRLPGEAPLISLLMEEFADRWTVQNEGVLVHVDATFTLSYAVIMLNVDQHNSNVKKNGNSMTLDEFRKNLKGVNGQNGAGEKKDFDQEMLKEIYNAIKSEEIVMPSEQSGLVKENYLWKVLMRRGTSQGCRYQAPLADEGVFDHDLFSLSWGPIVAALSFIFDKAPSQQTSLGSFETHNVITKVLGGFRKTATIAAHYGMSDVFDNLVISLVKFTSLLSSTNVPELGTSLKAQAATRTVFQLVHRHGDILREGWHNFIDALVILFKLGALPKILTESDDFTEPSGRVSIVRRSQISTPRVETGLFSSLYSYIALSADSPGSKGSVQDEEESRKKASTLIAECRPELLLSESKFLQLDALQELVKSLIYASPAPETGGNKSANGNNGNVSAGRRGNVDYDEDAVVFVLEVLLKISIQNRDRALEFWELVKEHMFSLILVAASNDMPFLLERSVVGLLRLALRLMRKEDHCPIILQSLKILLYLRPAAVLNLSCQMSFGLHEILKTTAANIHTAEEWGVIFSLLEYVGAGKVPNLLTLAFTTGPRHQFSEGDQKPVDTNLNQTLPPQHLGFPLASAHSLSQDHISQLGHSSGSDRGYTSDSELEIKSSELRLGSGNGNVSPAQSWILLSQPQEENGAQNVLQSPKKTSMTSTTAPMERPLFYPDPKALMKSCESLSFIVRDAAHITPDNFTLVVGAIRSFVEASVFKTRPREVNNQQGKKKRGRQHRPSVPRSKSYPASGQSGPVASPYDADESDSEEGGGTTAQVSVQLLDLLHTLHTRAAGIFQWWQTEKANEARGDESLWSLGWKPLLQAIAVLCADARRTVRTTALTYLQRALLVHDLQTLTASEWVSCFHEVLFPLLARLLEPLNPSDPGGVEETRVRASTLLCKVFLQHLTPLLGLESFQNLWLTILDMLEKYVNHSERSELLAEAVPESLKNLLLVMETAGVFHTPEGYTRIWAFTWEKIDSFLPGLRADLMRSVPPQQQQQQQQQQPQQIPTTLASAQVTTSGVPPSDQMPSTASLIVKGEEAELPPGLELPQIIPSGEEERRVSTPVPITTPQRRIEESTSQSSSPKAEYTAIPFGDEP